MKSCLPSLLLATITFLAACDPGTSSGESQDIAPSFKIAFGSCGHQDHPLPIFHEVVKQTPDLFIFLGDNIYGDTHNMDSLQARYDRLTQKESFQALKTSTPIIATWDDHDYGWNDSGRHYPEKEQSKEIFLKVWEEPADSERRERPGIYTAYTYEAGGKTIQVILLDTRTFRDDLLEYDGSLDNDRRYFYGLDYIPHHTDDSTLLGEVQWAWLDAELAKPADVRIIGSSTQFGIEFNSYEAWANFPHERERFLELIRRNRANGVIFISGDVHYAEISKMEEENLYPIYDVTASGLSSTWLFATPNRNRIEGPIMDNHFGLLTLDLGKQPVVKMEIWDINGNQRIEHRVPLSEISF